MEQVVVVTVVDGVDIGDPVAVMTADVGAADDAITGAVTGAAEETDASEDAAAAGNADVAEELPGEGEEKGGPKCLSSFPVNHFRFPSSSASRWERKLMVAGRGEALVRLIGTRMAEEGNGILGEEIQSPKTTTTTTTTTKS